MYVVFSIRVPKVQEVEESKYLGEAARLNPSLVLQKDPWERRWKGEGGLDKGELGFAGLVVEQQMTRLTDPTQ